MPATDLPGPNRPTVSILIAARNEEHTILDCLRAIAQLTAPPGYVEVLIGNDQSTDQTAERVVQFASNQAAFRLINIVDQVNNLAGKPNVLAQLARQARGEYLFFTDADTQVPANWLSEMTRYFTGDVGIVTGVTLPEGRTLFHQLQTLDWLYNLTLTNWVSSLGIPVTAMGNNMAIRRRAYESVGGYESLPFSVTEDYALFQALVQQGAGFRNLLSEEVLAHTQPVDTWRAFLQQRKRWMHGASQLPAWMVLALYGNYLAGPLLLLLGLFSPILAIGIYLIRLLLQTTLLSFGISRLRQTKLWPYALLFEAYQLILGPLAVIYYLLPTPITWKGRTYT